MDDIGIPPLWSDLPFWTETYPAIDAALNVEDGPVYPVASARFRALELCPPERVRVVILGQDPYHTPNKADGLAFSIPQSFPGRLDSLGNIFREIEANLGQKRTRTDLTDWAEQGVLLLNTALTVPHGRAKGHCQIGWSTLTEQVLARTSERPTAYVLWGGPAQSFAIHIHPGNHLILTAPHPSPLSAYRGFFGSAPFSQINNWLAPAAPIDWVGC